VTTPDLPRLQRVIEDEASLLKDFIVLLEQEEGLLVEGHTDALLTLADQKTQVYRRLQFLHDERSRITARFRQGSLQSVLASAPAAAARWEEVLSLAAEAQRHNAVNGQLIAERMKHNQAALSVLLAAADQPQLYGPDGQSRPTARGRPLGSV
jgi:flagellar biosynthesis protein FlgN